MGRKHFRVYFSVVITALFVLPDVEGSLQGRIGEAPRTVESQVAYREN